MKSSFHTIATDVVRENCTHTQKEAFSAMESCYIELKMTCYNTATNCNRKCLIQKSINFCWSMEMWAVKCQAYRVHRLQL